MNFSTPQRKKDTRPQPSALSVRILLCQYLRAVPEGDRDLLIPAHRDELDHAAPKAAVKVADGAVLRFQRLDKVRQPFALRFLCGNGCNHFIVPSLGFIVPPDQSVIAFLVLVLILCNAGVLRHDVLRHFHKHRHLFLQLAFLFLQCIGDAQRPADDLRIGDDFLLFRDQLVVRRYERRLDLILRDVWSLALISVVLPVAAVDDLAVPVRGMPDLRA
jgi:hypothetical protein